MARLIRTEKEVEGRFEDVWLVVEEDPLDPWPDGPGEIVGRPAPREDGVQRASRVKRRLVPARRSQLILQPGPLDGAEH